MWGFGCFQNRVVGSQRGFDRRFSSIGCKVGRRTMTVLDFSGSLNVLDLWSLLPSEIAQVLLFNVNFL